MNLIDPNNKAAQYYSQNALHLPSAALHQAFGRMNSQQAQLKPDGYANIATQMPKQLNGQSIPNICSLSQQLNPIMDVNLQSQQASHLDVDAKLPSSKRARTAGMSSGMSK